MIPGGESSDCPGWGPGPSPGQGARPRVTGGGPPQLLQERLDGRENTAFRAEGPLLEARSGVGEVSRQRSQNREPQREPGGPTSARPWLRPLFRPEQPWPGPRTGQKLAGRSSRILTATFLGGRRDRGRGRSPGGGAASSCSWGPGRWTPCPAPSPLPTPEGISPRNIPESRFLGGLQFGHIHLFNVQRSPWCHHENSFSTFLLKTLSGVVASAGPESRRQFWLDPALPRLP